jgi:secreted PhoX family phosphatase
VTYLTEDKNKGAIYRHVPDAQHSPFAEGDLQALKVRDIAEFDLSSGKVLGDHFDVEWVPIDDPSATTMPTRKQAKALGAARFSRGEGAFFAGGSAYFCSTNGGPTERGQVYRLDIGVSGQNDRLTLIAQADKEDALDRPDNITVAPWGDVFVAEDGKSPNGIFLIRPDGKAIQVARNAVNSGDSEVTGICFSPDGKWLFLNIQWEGLTVAVTGPFENLSTAV